MGTGASFTAIDSASMITPELVRNARLQEDLLAFVANLEKDGLKNKLVADASLAGTWVESFYDSELEITVEELNAETAAANVDVSKYAATLKGTYKQGAGSISGVLLNTRKTAQGVWREGDNEGLFQFDVVEGGLVFCGPFFHNGEYMGTWWGYNTKVRDLKNKTASTPVSAETDAQTLGAADKEKQDQSSAADTANAKALQKEFLEREKAARQEQADAAAAKKRALQERVARRKQQSGRIIPAPAHDTAVRRVMLDRGMVEDLLFDPNLDEDAVASCMQASMDGFLETLGRLFALGAVGGVLPRARLWSNICGKVEALSVDESDVDVMVGKVFREDEDSIADAASPSTELKFVHFVHFLFHLANAYTLMHEGMLGSDHALDKVVDVLQGVLLP